MTRRDTLSPVLARESRRSSNRQVARWHFSTDCAVRWFVCYWVDSVAKLGEGTLARNISIKTNGFLNQRCAITPNLESLFRARGPKIVLQHGVIPGSSQTKARESAFQERIGAILVWPCNDGERQWNTMSDWMCEGFRMPAVTDGIAHSCGWRTKTSKGGNRGNGYVRWCGARYGELKAARGAGSGSGCDRAGRPVRLPGERELFRCCSGAAISADRVAYGSRSSAFEQAPLRPVENQRERRAALRRRNSGFVVMTCRS